MPFGILVVYRILAIQVRQSEFVIYSTAPVLRGGAFVALMSSHVPLRLVPRSAMSF
jgi:multidrug efflux pump subunit AcrB